ncbi:MAG TPA: ATP-dependent 6-phosphofructokinase [Campylobacterales bacterium]|nr:ATP-dependent 6-phosphofructokinase [Campylobacterales bacterium]
MSIAIMTSGGDCAGMNPAIKYFVEHALSQNLNPYLIYDGLEGMIDNRIQKATLNSVNSIIHLGGTVIGSSRSKRFFEYNYRKQAYENLEKLGIDKIIVLGGDGSFRAMDVFFHNFGIKFVGIPSTIDNDIYGTEYCLGVDTALNIIRSSIDSIRDTASSFRRAFVVETMGRESGYLALISAITSGAEICVIPEMPYDLESKKRQIQKDIDEGKRYVLAVVAEGTQKTQEVYEFLKNDIQMDTRVTILGHIQRGGNPTVFDRLMASNFIKHSIDRILEKDCTGEVIVYKKSSFEFITIDYIASHSYKISDALIGLYRVDYCGNKC